MGKGKRWECRAMPGTPHVGRRLHGGRGAVFVSHREIYFVETCLNSG